MEPNFAPGTEHPDLPVAPRPPVELPSERLPSRESGTAVPHAPPAPPGRPRRLPGGTRRRPAPAAAVHAAAWWPQHPDLRPAAPPREAAPGAALWPWGLRGLSETLEVVALALLMFLAVRAVAQNFIVDGRSMEPTFAHGEFVIVNKLAYAGIDLSWVPGVEEGDWRPFGEPVGGDVVVFRFPGERERDFIKRVVAVAGQTVRVEDSAVYVDGVRIAEPYISEPPSYRVEARLVPQGSVFVLGDNRNNSFDSHSWGMLDASLIIGRAEFRYWPPSAIGGVDHVRQPRAPGPEVSRSPSTTK